MYNVHPEFLDKLKSMFKEHTEEVLGNDQKPSGNSQKVSGNIAVSNIEKAMGDDFKNLGKVGLATLGLIHGAQNFTNQAKEPALETPQQVESNNPYKEETAKVKNETMGDYLYNRHGMNHNQILGIVKTNPKLSSQYSYVQSLKPESIKDLMQHNKDFKNEVVRNHYSNLSNKTNGDFDKINLLWKHSNRIK